jgi:peptidoglycan/xylan/chitin deacetylase (PgdA/CDA1 family)
MKSKRLKIVISHDVDHLSIKEHLLKDLIIPKYIIWSFIELLKRKIYISTFLKRIKEVFQGKGWNNLGDLIIFDKHNKVPSTFFVAVNNGKGLNYSLKQAKEAIHLIEINNFDIGVHGINYNNYKKIKEEYNTFKKITNLERFGFRMHYLRLNSKTLFNLGKANYLFDSTILSKNLEQKKEVNGITELPFHLMDSCLFSWKNNLSIKAAKQKTIDLLNRAEEKNKEYVAIIFHQMYFSDTFPKYKNWYVWLINYCRKAGYKFVNYRDLL